MMRTIAPHKRPAAPWWAQVPELAYRSVASIERGLGSALPTTPGDRDPASPAEPSASSQHVLAPAPWRVVHANALESEREACQQATVILCPLKQPAAGEPGAAHFPGSKLLLVATAVPSVPWEGVLVSPSLLT